VDVILGGGSVFFDPKQRPDKRDLAGEFIKNDYELVRNRDGLLASRSGKLLGLFTKGHLPFEIDRANNQTTAALVPSLAEMARAALSRFLEAGQPFLLQVEGARIDHAAHLNDIAGLLGDQIAFDDAVAAVMGMTEGQDDILVVVTSDHGNSNPGLNGMGAGYGESTRHFENIRRMKASYERIFGEWVGLKNKEVTGLTDLVQNHLGFKLKPDEAEALLNAFNKKNIVEWNHQLENTEGLLGQISGNHTGIGWTGTTHTSDPTIVTALGPQSERFSGMVRNTDVFGHLVDLLG
jgi:alkaline phosphatase